MTSPARLTNSSLMTLRSNSRMRWTMTCLAVWAAMRAERLLLDLQVDLHAQLGIRGELLGLGERGSGTRILPTSGTTSLRCQTWSSPVCRSISMITFWFSP